MSEQPMLRIHVEFGQDELDFEGNADEVFKALVDFLNKVYPTFEIARNLIFIPDIRKLSEEIVGLVKITPEGPILILGKELPARKTLCLALLGSFLGNKLGKLNKPSLSPKELTKATGKAYKTIMNGLPNMLKDGLIEKADKEYRITSHGIIEARNIAVNYKSKENKKK